MLKWNTSRQSTNSICNLSGFNQFNFSLLTFITNPYRFQMMMMIKSSHCKKKNWNQHLVSNVTISMLIKECVLLNIWGNRLKLFSNNIDNTHSLLDITYTGNIQETLRLSWRMHHLGCWSVCFFAANSLSVGTINSVVQVLQEEVLEAGWQITLKSSDWKWSLKLKL